jgi:hypothetical protein
VGDQRVRDVVGLEHPEGRIGLGRATPLRVEKRSKEVKARS